MDLRRFAAYDALLLTAGIWFLAKFLRYAFPPLFEPLQATYGVSNTAVGLAFTGFMTVYALMQFPSGVLADRLGSVRVIAAGVALAAAGSLVLVVEPPIVPFGVLAAAMLVLGAGTGAHKTVAVRLLSNVYPSRTGRALGVLDTVGALGGVAAPAAVAGALALAAGAWRGVFAAAGVVGLVLAVGFNHRIGGQISDATQANEDASGTLSTDEDGTDAGRPGDGTDADRPGDGTDAGRAGLRTYLAPFGNAGFATFVAVTVCYSFAYNGVVAFLPLYLTREAALAPATASLLYGVLFAASLVQLATGEVADAIGPLPVIAGCLALAGTALAAVVALAALGGAATFAGGAALVALGGSVLAVGLGAHGFRPVRDAYLVALIPDATTGGTLGVVRTTLMGAGAASPAIVGIVADAIGFRPAFALLAASFGLGSTIAVGLLLRE